MPMKIDRRRQARPAALRVADQEEERGRCHQPHRQPEHEDPQRPRPPLRGEEVADERARSRRVARLADADAHARDEERPEAPGEGVGCREGAPYRDSPADHLPARAAVGEASERQPGDGVDDGEGGGDDAELEVVEPPLEADGAR